MKVKDWFTDMGKLLFPKLCFLCKEDLISDEEQLCSSCVNELPFTNFHEHKENALCIKLQGRFEFEAATALLYFNTEGKVQEILHEIKYRGNIYLAQYLGKLMASRLKEYYKEIDILVPIPLHKKRTKERGYNQSEEIAKGISELLSIPVISNSALRVKHTETQTHKTRSERAQNMQEAFQWNEVRNKHILLIDDVITTGSTLESLVSALPAEWNNTISILSLSAAIEA